MKNFHCPHRKREKNENSFFFPIVSAFLSPLASRPRWTAPAGAARRPSPRQRKRPRQGEKEEREDKKREQERKDKDKREQDKKEQEKGEQVKKDQERKKEQPKPKVEDENGSGKT